MSKGNADTKSVHQSADVFVWPKTNEGFVADGYVNRRVIVFDSETGAFKRYWGAYGNKPNDDKQPAYSPSAPPSRQFANPVHCATLSRDGKVYVCDRTNNRIQVFTIDGKFVKEGFVAKATLSSGGTVYNLGFSGDATCHLLWRLMNGEVEGQSPRLAVILIGANNMGRLHWPADEDITGIEAVLQDGLAQRFVDASMHRQTGMKVGLRKLARDQVGDRCNGHSGSSGEFKVVLSRVPKARHSAQHISGHRLVLRSVWSAVARRSSRRLIRRKSR